VLLVKQVFSASNDTPDNEMGLAPGAFTVVGSLQPRLDVRWQQSTDTVYEDKKFNNRVRERHYEYSSAYQACKRMKSKEALGNGDLFSVAHCAQIRLGKEFS
jgi:hypothetical protein